MEPILQVRNLTTRLVIEKQPFPVVEEISFDLFPGKTLALVGESGCGKTLTALSIMGILPTPPAERSTGEVLYQGRNLLRLKEKEMRKIRGGRIAMIFQDPSTALNPVYTVGDQMGEVSDIHLKLDEEEGRLKAIEALREVGLARPEDMLDVYPHQLSGGMKQRVMIAMALMCEPDVLIADEPTTALDVTIQAQVLDLIRALQKTKGTAVLLITHDMGVVAELADDVIVMYAAQGVEKGSVRQIFDHAAHPYTQGLFASRPSQQPPHAKLKTIKGTVPSAVHFPKGCRFHPRCPYVMDKCREGEVPDFELEKRPPHISKCWLHDGSEESALKLERVQE